MSKFENLVDALTKNNYDVKIEKGKLYDFARVTGKGIFAGFCTKHYDNHTNSSYAEINGKISADNLQCFDKWSKCPLSLDLPSNEVEMNFLIKRLEYWGSEQGFNSSNNFDYDMDEYPK